jgi:hypothetical protein
VGTSTATSARRRLEAEEVKKAALLAVSQSEELETKHHANLKELENSPAAPCFGLELGTVTYGAWGKSAVEVVEMLAGLPLARP